MQGIANYHSGQGCVGELVRVLLSDLIDVEASSALLFPHYTRVNMFHVATGIAEQQYCLI